MNEEHKHEPTIHLHVLTWQFASHTSMAKAKWQKSYRMYGLPWIPISCLVTSEAIRQWFPLVTNTDFRSRVRWFGNDFHKWKLLPNRFTSYNPLKQLSIAHFAIIYYSDLEMWRHHNSSCNVTQTRGTGIVTSFSSIVFDRVYWRKSYLHRWVTTVKIDFPTPGLDA